MRVIIYGTCHDVWQGGFNMDITGEPNDLFLEFILNNVVSFEVKELYNSFFMRIIYNLLTAYNLGLDDLEMHNKLQKQNKSISGAFLPLFRKKGHLIIEPIECNENTVITIYLTNKKVPYIVEVENGEIKILKNSRGFKKFP